jgi:SNF2 family DNA or RNA helicase
VAVLAELDDTGKYIVIQAEYRWRDLCNKVPGLRWNNKKGTWSMPVSWAGCLALRSTFRKDLEVGPMLTDWSWKEFNNRVNPANTLRDIVAVEEGDPDLFAHQRAGVQFLATARRALLADEPGLGKTAQAIRAMTELTRRGENPFPALIVCPNTLKSNWEREFHRWWPGVNVQVVRGSALQRRKQLLPLTDPKEGEPVPHVIIVNWESLRSHSRLAPYGSVALKACKEHGGEDEKVTAAQCEIHERELNKINFKTVVADEIHRSKDPKAKQTRALWAATGDADIRFALTGTPISNDVLDLWSILHWLSPDEWPNKTKWITRMLDTMTNAFGSLLVNGVKPEMQEEFYASLNPRMRRMLKKVVLPWLPEILYERRDVEMSAKQKKAYQQMRDHMIAEVENGDYSVATTVLSQMTRLLQFASSYAEIEEVDVVDDKTGEVTKKVNTTLIEPSGAIDAFIDDVKSGDFSNDSVAVTAVSRQLIELLSKRLEKEKIPHGLITGAQTADQRQAAVDDFQNGRTKFILFTAAAGGVGVTLTAARVLVRLQRPFSLVDDLQVRDRVHRIGSEVHDSIIVMDYITEGTVQERVPEILDVKGQNFEEVVKDQDQLLKLLQEDKAAK